MQKNLLNQPKKTHNSFSFNGLSIYQDRVANTIAEIRSRCIGFRQLCIQ